MTMLRRLLERTVPILLIGAVIVDLALIGAILVAKRELVAVRATYGRGDGSDPVPIPAGFTLDGTPLEINNVRYAVWFASSKCPYCQRDEEWRRLAGILAQRGVRVIVLLPSASDAFADDGAAPENAQQVVYMNGDWIRRYPLSGTPTLLIFDRQHQLLWHRYGMLRPADAEAVLTALDSARGE
jgi:hypothetical protein